MSEIFRLAFLNPQTAVLLELLHWFKSFCDLKWEGESLFEKNWNELRQMIENENRSCEEFYIMLQYLSEYKKEGLFVWPDFDLKSCFLNFEPNFFYGSSQKVHKRFRVYLTKLKNRFGDIIPLENFSKAA
jgi:hypothetical protein